MNPKRNGGGSSVAEAVYKGLPAVTLPVGDVSAAAGESFRVADYGEMAETILKEQADMVIGSRFIEKEGFQSSFTRRLGIRYFTFLIKILTGQKITDPTSGYRMCNRKIIELFAGNYPKDYPEPETTTWILRKKLKVLEIPVIMRAREEGVSSISLKKSFYYMFKVTMAIIIERTRR